MFTGHLDAEGRAAFDAELAGLTSPARSAAGLGPVDDEPEQSVAERMAAIAALTGGRVVALAEAHEAVSD